MPKFFEIFEKTGPIFGFLYKIFLFICKVLLIADILIVSYAVAGRYLHRWIPFLTDPSWSEEVVLTLMSFMAVLSAALAIRRDDHIRMTAFDRYLPPMLIKVLDLFADFAVLALGIVMLAVGWRYTTTVGARGTYTSMPMISRFWMYLPVPLAGLAMIIFEIETIVKHIKRFFVSDDNAAAKDDTAEEVSGV